MPVETVKETYTGKVREVVLGSGEGEVKVGGQTTMPFYTFEGDMPNKPKIAMEVYDETEEWSDWAKEPFADVIDDPPSWAKKCQDTYKTDMVTLQLRSTDPNGSNTSADDAAETTKKVLDAIDIPLIVMGSGNIEKDQEVLKKVAEVAHGKNIAIGPAQEDNYKAIAAAAMAYNHKVIAQSPVDINIAKQLNILITQLGVSADNIIMDPTTGALGYGLEYTYTIMERLRLAALQQNDDMTNMPIICDLGLETWKTKEAKVGVDEEPTWGDPKTRAITWEAVTANSLMMAGADILVMRHPEAIKLVRNIIDSLS
ncbi:MAG: acetyl-CoA decarbonylase/synthase complex subunit delta [Actinobacteria bacterium]|nr:MAG: acetyl-CoA decarbonylase/synthase complex subunit delta [Actinomycetota bacterium]